MQDPALIHDTRTETQERVEAADQRGGDDAKQRKTTRLRRIVAGVAILVLLGSGWILFRAATKPTAQGHIEVFLPFNGVSDQGLEFSHEVYLTTDDGMKYRLVLPNKSVVIDTNAKYSVWGEISDPARSSGGYQPVDPPKLLKVTRMEKN